MQIFIIINFILVGHSLVCFTLERQRENTKYLKSQSPRETKRLGILLVASPPNPSLLISVTRFDKCGKAQAPLIFTRSFEPGFSAGT